MISLCDRTLDMEQVLPLVLEQLQDGRSVRFTPRGVSMRPMLEGGRDQVILSPLPERLKKYDLPLYRRDNGQYVLHRIVKTGQVYTCVGDNQFTLETGVRREQMLALVTGFVRKGKSWSVEAPAYRLYCRLWCFGRPLRRLALGGYRRIRRLLSGRRA